MSRQAVCSDSVCDSVKLLGTGRVGREIPVRRDGNVESVGRRWCGDRSRGEPTRGEKGSAVM